MRRKLVKYTYDFRSGNIARGGCAAAIIDVVKYDGPANVFAWKHPNSELSTWTQLIVNETQEAVLFKGGEALDLFGAGRHTLSTPNIPLLQSLINIPFGGRSPFAAEIWFVNKLNTLDIKWGTASPLQLQDPKYNVILPVRSFGQFGLQIEDARKFLLKLIGTLPIFDKEAMTKYFRGVLMMNIRELITSYIVHKRISILEMNAFIGEIASHVMERSASVFAEYGVRLLNFYVESINVPDDDPATARLKEALAKKAEMDIMGYTYQQERTFDTLEGAARNDGMGGGVMNAGMGLGMGFGLGGNLGQVMSMLTNQFQVPSGKSCPSCHAMNEGEAQFCASCGYRYAPPAAAQTSAPQTVTCSHCGNSMPARAKFCPHCGDLYSACPKCGADNPENAARCGQCGTSLGPQINCHSCGEPLSGEAKFCMNCGTSTSLTCSRCQHDIKPNQKFCLECGNELSRG